MIWTEEQVRAAVTDAATLKRGQQLVNPSKWSNTGSSARAVWGECAGSGKLPYQVVIDLAGPAFKCSCPSRVFPCKHGAGLMLLAVRHASVVQTVGEPTWVAEWLDKRQAKAETKAVQPDNPKAPADPEAQAKREAERLERMMRGAADLELWLMDTVRTGLAQLQSQSTEVWAVQAARLVDAQLPGLATSLQAMVTLQDASQQLAAMGELFLLTRALQQVPSLPEAARSEVLQQVGVALKKEQVLAEQPAVHDQWWVLGQVLTQEDRLTVRRLWLYGIQTQRYALLLDFAFAGQGFASSFMLNALYEGALHYFPGLYPLRAVAKELHMQPEAPNALPVQSPLAMLDGYAQAIEANPWLRQYPVWVGPVVPEYHRQQWYLRHAADGLLPVWAQTDMWPIAAESGGQSLNMFGEWDGRALRPISIAASTKGVPA